MWILCWFHSNPALAQSSASWYWLLPNAWLKKVKWLVALSPWIRVSECLTFSKCLTAWPLAAEWLCPCVQSGGTLSCVRQVTFSTFCVPSGRPQSYALMTLPYWEGGTLPRWPSWGIEVIVSSQDCSLRKQRWEASHLWRIFSEKEISEHPGMTEMPMKERWPQTPLRRPLERKWVIWLCSLGEQTVWQFSSAKGHRLLSWYPLNWSWTPWSKTS